MRRMPSNLTSSLARSPQAKIERSSIDRSYGRKSTFNLGVLVPIFLDEVLPADTFTLSCELYARLATPKFPLMDNLYFDVHFFYVPNRLLWNNWEKMMGAQDDPGDSIDFTTPQISPPATTGAPVNSMWDYFALPTNIDNLSVSALPFRAYNLIYNEWYRDQNFHNSRPIHKGDGPDDYNDYKLQRRAKRHDYFTSCLPWPQKNPVIPILPDLDTLAVTSNSKKVLFSSFDGTSYVDRVMDPTLSASANVFTAGGASIVPGTDPSSIFGAETGLQVNLSDFADATVNTLRQAFQIQKMYERDARGGTRYVEILKSHFGVTSPDFRLQRPEYLGGTSTPLRINPVPQTSATETTTTPQGNISAYGEFGFKYKGFSKSFVEHGWIMGLASIRSDLSYQFGIPKMFSRSTRFDYYLPVFAHLGEQAVLNKEIYAQGTDVTNALGVVDDQVFGYQERWAEYRYKSSEVTGEFRSRFSQSLDAWHLSQNFDRPPFDWETTLAPVLDSTFIEEHAPIDRTLALPSESAFPNVIFDSYFSNRCARPMPMFSVPGLIDHF